MENEIALYKKKVLFTIKCTLIAIIISLAFFHSISILLLIFAGILVAIFFRGLSDFISHKTPLSPGWSLFLVIASLTLLSAFGWYFMAPAIAQQIDQLTGTIPEALDRISSWSKNYSWSENFLQDVDIDSFLKKTAGGAISKATVLASTVLNGILYFLLILAIGIYLAVAPHVYSNGLLSLIPLHRRGRMKEIFRKIARTLKWWLIGRFIDMAFIGSLLWLGLWILDVPLALTLAIIAGVLNFIPNIGPFLGAIPAILIGFTQDTETVLWIITLFTVVQTLESLFTTPMVQQRAIHLPPGLTISSQILLGAAFGTIGLAVATPLMAALIIAIRELYVKDTLGDNI
jgi:predicted PurR-regulated permease PerM